VLDKGDPNLYVPVPVRLTFCGLPPPSSVMRINAVLFPIALGWKVALIVQLALAAMLVPQLLVCEKSPEFVPITSMPLKFSCVLPTFVRVTLSCALVVLII